MRVKPTREEVLAEVETLRQMKPNVRRTSTFGDNHHETIDAQIRVGAEDLSVNRIYDKFGKGADPNNPSNDEQISSILDMRYWMDGEGEDDPPSNSWQDLVK